MENKIELAKKLVNTLKNELATATESQIASLKDKLNIAEYSYANIVTKAHHINGQY